MDNKIEMYKEMVLKGEKLEKEQAMELLTVDLDELCKAADEIRKAFCDNKFDMCTIINGKSGRCSENCKYCAQAACHKTEVENYPLLSTEEILEDAKKIESQGVRRYSIVTSGKRLNAAEVDQMCECIKKLREETNLHVCGSFGLLDKEAFGKLKEAGLTRVHNNLETSRRYFPDVCTTHTFDDKIAAITAAKEAGLEVCSGGIMGIGETMEDPDAFIRLAGGRGLMEDKGRGCMESGANAAISGDMLTTSGITVKTDFQLLGELGYEIVD